MASPMPVFDPKAIIEGRAPGRASVGLITGTVIAAVCALIMLLVLAADSELRGHGELPFLIALPVALLPVPLLIALVLLIDRLEPEPRANLIFGFIWGAGVAALVALVINTLGLEFVTMPALGKNAGEYVSATFGAPPVEETLKGLGLILLLRLRRQELDGPTDGIIYAAMIGLGFAMMENVSYYIGALVKPEIGGVKLLGITFVLRGLLSPFAHPIFTSMTGLGVAYAASHRRSGWAIPMGWFAAMLLHGTWNGLSERGLGGLGAAYLIVACALAGLIIVLVRDRNRIIGLIKRTLPGYVPTGLVTPQDVAMLATLAGRRAARHWARVSGGRSAAAAMTDYQLAATELAMLHQRAERGVIGPQEFETRRQALLSLMHAARMAFLPHRPAPLLPPWAPHGASGFVQRAAYPAPMPPPGFPVPGPPPGQPWQ
jgi:RsiW-degrading membrane proteinase PrsW (M82 family)